MILIVALELLRCPIGFQARHNIGIGEERRLPLGAHNGEGQVHEILRPRRDGVTGAASHFVLELTLKEMRQQVSRLRHHAIEQELGEFVGILLLVNVEPKVLGKGLGIECTVSTLLHARQQVLQQRHDCRDGIVLLFSVGPGKDPLEKDRILRQALELCIEPTRRPEVPYPRWHGEWKLVNVIVVEDESKLDSP